MEITETTMYEEKYWVTEYRTLPKLVDYLRNQNNYTEVNNAFESYRIIEEYVI
jgi:acid phosphatase class B